MFPPTEVRSLQACVSTGDRTVSWWAGQHDITEERHNVNQTKWMKHLQQQTKQTMEDEQHFLLFITRGGRRLFEKRLQLSQGINDSVDQFTAFDVGLN